MLRFARRLSEEHGQSLILLVLGLTVMFVVGAIAVDVGLWLSERRGSQTDADFAALAGAYELLKPGASSSAAVTAATKSLAANNQQGNASFTNNTPYVDKSCPWTSSTNDAVSVDVIHDSHSLFSGIFGTVSPNIGAHAKACVGAANGLTNIVPLYMSNTTSPCFNSNTTPKFTTLCGLKAGAQGGTSGDRGLLDLATTDGSCSTKGGSGNIANLIANGAPGTCLINTSGTCGASPLYDCVYPEPGNKTSDTLTGVQTRLARPALCDTNYGNKDGVDDFYETIQVVFNTGDPATSIYAPRDCDPSTPGVQISPRLITIIILGQPVGNGKSTDYPIVAFAAFYLAGCADERNVVTSEADLIKTCSGSGMPPAGHTEVYGRFVNIIYAGSAIGPPSPSTTAFGISLVD